jgi:hypothetical protein
VDGLSIVRYGEAIGERMNFQDVEVDDLHRPFDDDLWFTETAWYSFWNSSGTHIGHIYLRFRPNIGVADCNFYIWTAGISAPWDAVYWKCFQMSVPSSLTSLDFVGGLHHEVVEDLASYRIRFEDLTADSGGLRLNLELDALGSPRWFGRKHFDQAMRVSGCLSIDGVDLDIQCRAMRDRSWYSRSDFGTYRSAYSYVLSDDAEILVLQAIPKGSNPQVADVPVVGGYLRRDGEEVGIVGGRRIVLDRDSASGAPAIIALEVKLANQRRLRLEGVSRNAIAIAANTGMLSWMNLVEWDWAGGVVLGEDQEIWSPSIWRRFRADAVARRGDARRALGASAGGT